MVLEEEPAKVSEALRYFLQGLGFGKLHTKEKCPQKRVELIVMTEDHLKRVFLEKQIN